MSTYRKKLKQSIGTETFPNEIFKEMQAIITLLC